MLFSIYGKAKGKSGKKSVFAVIEANNDKRALRDFENLVEDNNLDSENYFKPLITDTPVVDDLPATGVLSETWCDKYVLQDDKKTWLPQGGTANTAAALAATDILATTLTPDEQVIAAYHFNSVYLTPDQMLVIDEAMKADPAGNPASEMAFAVTNYSTQEAIDAELVRGEYPDVETGAYAIRCSLVEDLKKIWPGDKINIVGWRVMRKYALESLRADVAARKGILEKWVDGQPGNDGLENNNTPDTQPPTDGGPTDEGAQFAGGEAHPVVDKFRNTEYPELKTVAALPFRQRLLAEFLSNEYVYHADADLMRRVIAAEMDTDNSYLQNLMLAAENVPEFKEKAREVDLAFISEGIKAIWPMEGKKPDLNLLMTFIRDWWATPHINRGIFVKSWRTGKPCGPMPMKTTDTGTNAGGVEKTDRSGDYEHTLDTLDQEIAAALLPMDFDIYSVPGGVIRRCNEVVKSKEQPFKSWSALLRKSAGILDYSRAAIFALIRNARPDLHEFPVEHQEYINRSLTEYQHDKPSAETLAAARHLPGEELQTESGASAAIGSAWEELGGNLDKAINNAPETQAAGQPEFKSVGGGIFSVDGLMSAPAANAELPASNDGEKDDARETVCTGCGAVGGGHCPDCGAVAGDATYAAMEEGLKAELDAVADFPGVNQDAPKPEQTQPEAKQAEPATVPAYFEPGRYEGIPNKVYHGANGISSSMIKDARVSLMYYHGRHVGRTIEREETDALFFGTLVHSLTLEPEKFDDEYVVFPGVPMGAISTSNEMKEIIERFNASMPPLLSADEIKRQIEAYNATLPAPLSLSGNAEETAALYASLAGNFQTIPEGEKQTAGAMRERLKKFNATLPAPLKTSGSRDALLDQLATVDSALVAAERAKPQPYNTSGNKDDLKKIVREINPQVIFADEYSEQWRIANSHRRIVSFTEYTLLREMHAAVYAHPNAGKMLRHPGRATEVSYFGVDEETGLEVRIRPDLEVTIDGVRIALDLKTISTGKIKEAQLRQKLHREIIDRDYHVSAAMYTEVGGFDQFFWIFVNKDKGHHWCAVVEASSDLLSLGLLEYRQTMRRISTALDTGDWSAPITDFTDELTDFDARRLEALRTA
ncbi:exodeoxyribonuclease [Salmonella enterica]|nr:exodeoxyribonuclease [Salmonella enterica]EBL7405572.1 exodeoxyribonuclease [Salmonella enterica]EBM1967271.1 exodeoxyribonuclease [Salmonella enterica]EHB7345959.1 exodeoxyribonuclease [Salmonella enterica subsp. enterica serovar Bracknell]HAC7849353.1 exodeoxyribonuclease [Salmonella enterica]